MMAMARRSDRLRLARALRGAHLEEGFEDLPARMAEAQRHQRRIGREELRSRLRSYLRGAASILSIWPLRDAEPVISVEEALKRDMEKVGKDFERAMRKIDGEKI